MVLDVGRSDRYWYPRSALDSGYPKTAQTAPGLAGTRNGSVFKRVMKRHPIVFDGFPNLGFVPSQAGGVDRLDFAFLSYVCGETHIFSGHGHLRVFTKGVVLDVSGHET